jgi:hypothetical protein
MNKIITLLSALVLVLVLSFTAKAQLPDILDLPQTFSQSNSSGSIDLNDDGIADFDVYFNYYSASGSGGGISYECYIEGAQSGNKVLSEMVGVDRAPATTNPPLTKSNDSWVSILPFGANIDASPAGDLFWFSSDKIAWKGIILSPAPTAPFYETPQGYIGVQFDIDGQLHFGWIQVSVDDAVPSVTLGEPHAYASAPGSPILAGASGVVPVPIIASVFGFLAIGAGLYFRRKRKK